MRSRDFGVPFTALEYSLLHALSVRRKLTVEDLVVSLVAAGVTASERRPVVRRLPVLAPDAGPDNELLRALRIERRDRAQE